MIPRQVGEDQCEERQRHDRERGGAGRRRGKAITLVDVQDQQDRAGDEVMNAEYPKRLLVPTY